MGFPIIFHPGVPSLQSGYTQSTAFLDRTRERGSTCEDFGFFLKKNGFCSAKEQLFVNCPGTRRTFRWLDVAVVVFGLGERQILIRSTPKESRA